MSINVQSSFKPRVVIIGGGFAGIELAKKLSHKPVQVVLIDKHNYHTFQPLLYQVATAGLEPGSIAYPLRKLFHNVPNVVFRWTKVKEIDPQEKKVTTEIGVLEYDYLVIATGSKTNFFNFDQEAMMKMKTIPQALNLRSLILQNFEKALQENDPEERKALMNFAIVGGGPTGVELAGALAEMKHYILPKDYPELNFEEMQICLYESAPRVLAAMSEQSSAKAEKYLKKLGVVVYTDNRVQKHENGYIILKDGTKKFTDTVIWTAGVKGATINGVPKEVIGRSNRIKVDKYNQVIGYNNLFAVGDIAYLETEAFPYGLPMLAQVAIQQGRHLAKNILKKVNGHSLIPFEYKDKGSMATIGRNLAVVDLPNFKFQGFFAWFVWMFIHIISLIGFRNKAQVFVNWVYSYFTYNRALRLIIRPFSFKKIEDILP